MVSISAEWTKRNSAQNNCNNLRLSNQIAVRHDGISRYRDDNIRTILRWETDSSRTTRGERPGELGVALDETKSIQLSTVPGP